MGSVLLYNLPVCIFQRPQISGSLEADHLSIKVGESAVHTLHSTAEVWSQLGKQGSTEAVISHSYIICNNTQDKLRLKQVCGCNLYTFIKSPRLLSVALDCECFLITGKCTEILDCISCVIGQTVQTGEHKQTIGQTDK